MSWVNESPSIVDEITIETTIATAQAPTVNHGRRLLARAKVWGEILTRHLRSVGVRDELSRFARPILDA